MSSIMQRVHEEETRIWTPEGARNSNEMRAARLVEDYDPNLILARHTMTGDWCVWLKQPHGKVPRPVIGLGPELPDAETLLGRVRQADSRVRGDAILNEMREENDKLQKEQARVAEDATGQAAEAMAWAQTDIKGYSGRYANVKGHKRDFKERG